MNETHQPEEHDTNLAVGDSVLWAATNGNVRSGRLVEWVPLTSSWFVEFEASGPTKPESGFSTWLPPETLIKIR